MQHVEDFSDGASQDAQYYESYEDLNVHRVMLTDEPRMRFYKSVLSNPDVVGGKVVVDVGSGTGVLSIWAAQGGAQRVISIEASAMASIQPLLFEENGVADRITVIQATVESLVEKGVQNFIDQYPFIKDTHGVAVVVSEWMGFYLLHEGMLPSVIRAKAFFKEVNKALGHQDGHVAMIPSHASIYAAPITLQPLYEEKYAAFWNSVDGVRMETIGKMAFNMAIEAASPLVEVLPEKCLLHEGMKFWEGDLGNIQEEELLSITKTQNFSFVGSKAFTRHLTTADDGGVSVDGFTTWFKVSFRDTVLSTSPADSPTHWKQTTLLLPEECREAKAMSFEKEEESFGMTLALTARSAEERYYTMEYELH